MCTLYNFIEASKQRHVSFLSVLPDSVRNEQPGQGKQAQKKQLGPGTRPLSAPIPTYYTVYIENSHLQATHVLM